MARTCPVCPGSGLVTEMRRQPCVKCEGTGANPFGAPCSHCGQTGSYEQPFTYRCPRCNGTGEIAD